MERLGVKEHKIQRLLEKAWNSTEELNPSAYRRAYNSKFHRGGQKIVKVLMGHTFIFAKSIRGTKILITFI